MPLDSAIDEDEELEEEYYCARCGRGTYGSCVPCEDCADENEEDGSWPCLSCGQHHEGTGPLCSPCYRQAKELKSRGYTSLKMAMGKRHVADAIDRAFKNNNQLVIQ